MCISSWQKCVCYCMGCGEALGLWVDGGMGVGTPVINILNMFMDFILRLIIFTYFTDLMKEQYSSQIYHEPPMSSQRYNSSKIRFSYITITYLLSPTLSGGWMLSIYESKIYETQKLVLSIIKIWCISQRMLFPFYSASAVPPCELVTAITKVRWQYGLEYRAGVSDYKLGVCIYVLQ